MDKMAANASGTVEALAQTPLLEELIESYKRKTLKYPPTTIDQLAMELIYPYVDEDIPVHAVPESPPTRDGL